MGQLRDQLVDDYAEHFARLNASLDAQVMRPADFRMLDRTFGPVLTGVPHGARILDVGCGVGLLLNWLSKKPGLSLVGVDASPSQLEIARRNMPEVNFICEDGFEYLQSHTDSFDGIFCTDVLEHILGTDHCIEWVAAARAALRPGGFFACRAPNAASLIAPYARYIDLTHERIFTQVSMLQLLSAGGLQDARILPIRAGDFTGRVRQAVEKFVHKLAYRVFGQGGPTQFTTNLCAVGYRRD